MAFMGRGGFPSMGNNNLNGIQKDNLKSESRNDFCRGYCYYGRFRFYVPLDNTYVIMQMIVTFIIIIVGLIAFFLTYKTTIVDPIESTKELFINTYLIIIGILLAITLSINFLSKSKETLIKRLVIISIISMLIMIIFYGIKINLDSTYTKDKFEKIYTEQTVDESNNHTNKSRIDIGITGMSIKTEKEYYIDECSKLYDIFSVKAYATIGIHLLLNILLIYQISRISKIQTKKDNLSKDDLILFDDEENVKL